MEVNPEKENQIPEQLAKHVNEAWAAVPPNTLDQSKWMSQDECHNALSAWIDKMLENGKLKGLSDDTMSEIAKCRTYTTSGDIANAHSEYEKAYDLYNGIGPNSPEPSPYPGPPNPKPPSPGVQISGDTANINLDAIVENGDIWKSDGKSIDTDELKAYLKKILPKSIQHINIGKISLTDATVLNDALKNHKTPPSTSSNNILKAISNLYKDAKGNTKTGQKNVDEFFNCLKNMVPKVSLTISGKSPTDFTPLSHSDLANFSENLSTMGVTDLDWDLPKTTNKHHPFTELGSNLKELSKDQFTNTLITTNYPDPSDIPKEDKFSELFSNVMITPSTKASPKEISDEMFKWLSDKNLLNYDLSKISLRLPKTIDNAKDAKKTGQTLADEFAEIVKRLKGDYKKANKIKNFDPTKLVAPYFDFTYKDPSSAYQPSGQDGSLAYEDYLDTLIKSFNAEFQKKYKS